MTYDLVYGKDSRDNWDKLDLASGEDYWFHLKHYPSSHVFLSLKDGMKIDGSLLFMGAILCKLKSKHKNANFISVEYTQVKNLRKTKTVGEVEILKGRKKIVV